MSMSDVINFAMGAGGLITALVAVYLARSARAKALAEAEAAASSAEEAQATAAEQVSEAWSRLQAPMKERITHLEQEVLKLKAREAEKDKRIGQLETTVEAAMRYISAMERRMDEAGINPPEAPAELVDWLENHEGS